MFISFANFYWRFIRDFSKIAALLTSMFKIIGLSEKLALKVFRAGNNKIVRSDGSRVDKTVVDSSKSKNKKSWKLIYMPNIGAIEEPIFLISNAIKVFIQF